MAAAKDNWNQLAIAPLSGLLDTRSRPADLSPGVFRYKLNLSVNRTGGLCVQTGFHALDLGPRSDNPALTRNWDFHRRNLPVRDAVNFLYESTATDGVRHLFAGTASTLHVMDNGTSEWTALVTGLTDARWMAGTVGDVTSFTSGLVGGLYYVNLVTLAITTGFTGALFSQARVIIPFAGFNLAMNVLEGANLKPSRVFWSDFQVGNDFTPPGPTVSGFQDLDYGDPILNAVEMMGALYIFTTRAIWRCATNPSTDPATPSFLFQRIYSEPENQTGCLVYPNTLVTTGRELYWWSHDSIWTFNPYIVTPESADWLLRGSGAVFSDDNPDRTENRCCETIIGKYRPLTREIRYSYPQDTGSATPVCINNRELVLNTEYRTMHLSDAGFSAYCNFRQTPGLEDDCNSGQVFIGASTTDYCLKSFESVYSREFASLVGGSRTTDISDANYATTLSGYYCRIAGLAPFGYPNREKVVRELLLDHEIKPNSLASPNLITLRIGNHINLVDPMSLEARCSPAWHSQDSLPLTCPDEATIAAMLADNRRPSDPLSWTLWETGCKIYFDLRITSATGTAPMEHNACFSAFRFDVMLV